MWIAAGSVLIVIFMYLFLVFPAPATKQMRARFKGHAYAHRGLHDVENGLIENTLPAFQAAADAGYGIELDVQLTKDMFPVVFHDLDLSRACGDERRICDIDLDELVSIPIFGSSGRIPLFADVLNAVNGCVPLVVEIKSDGNRALVKICCETVAAMLLDYDGDYCIESFDPYAVQWFFKNVPKIVRGQLVMGISGYNDSIPWKLKVLMVNLFFNFLTRPNFIAFRHCDRGFPLKVVKLLGAMSVMWTVTNQDDHDKLSKSEDAIIFEGYLPATRY